MAQTDEVTVLSFDQTRWDRMAAATAAYQFKILVSREVNGNSRLWTQSVEATSNL